MSMLSKIFQADEIDTIIRKSKNKQQLIFGLIGYAVDRLDNGKADGSVQIQGGNVPPAPLSGGTGEAQ